jgi:AraC family L-rhamnose operon transcriptional activator RhaR
MHRILRREVFAPGAPPVAVERFDRVGWTAPHSHDFIELSVVTRGTGTHVSAAGERPVRRGAMTILRPGDWHGYRGCRGLALANVYVGPEVLQRELAWLRDESYLARLMRVSGGAQLDDTTLQVAEALAHTGLGHATRIGLLLCLLGSAARNQPPPPGDSPVHSAVLTATQLLESHLAHPWTLGELAAAGRVSPAHLARLFSAQIGEPAMVHLGRLRAERAAALLIETDLPVAEIGRRVGWTDPNYVSRRFRQHFAYSPSQYRSRFRPTHGQSPNTGHDAAPRER